MLFFGDNVLSLVFVPFVESYESAMDEFDSEPPQWPCPFLPPAPPPAPFKFMRFRSQYCTER